MSDTPVDNSKRTWLIASTCAGAVGAGFVATPFVSTFQPSERAKAAGAAVEVDISEVKPGEKLTVEWRGKPVWIMRRTTEQVEALKKLDGQLADPASERQAYPTPEYAKNTHRSIKPVHGGCWHLHPLGLLAWRQIPDRRAAFFARRLARWFLVRLPRLYL